MLRLPVVEHDRPLGWLLVMLAAAATFTFATAYVRRWVGGRVALEVQFDLRNAIYDRLQRLDFAGHDQLQTGQLVSRASSDLGLLPGTTATGLVAAARRRSRVRLLAETVRAAHIPAHVVALDARRPLPFGAT